MLTFTHQETINIMFNNIKSLKTLAYYYFAVSLLTIIAIFSYQGFVDSDKPALDNYFLDQENYIKELNDRNLIRKLEVQLLAQHNIKADDLNEKSAQELNDDLEDFLINLELIQDNSQVIKALKSRVRNEEYYTRLVFITIVVFGLILFVLIIDAIRKHNNAHQKKIKEWVNITFHELRSSVVPLKMGSDILLNIDQTKSERDETLRLLNSDAKKLEDLTTQMLDLYDLGEKESIKVQPVDIEPIIQQAIHGSQSSNKKDLEFSCSIDIEQKIEGNVDLIERVIKNLIGNAVGFSHLKGAISIEAFDKDNFTIINVIDQGVGFKDKDTILASVVRPAKRVDGGDGISHHGLGLKFVKKIMKLHGGKFDIENNIDGKGVTATVKFPISN